jgi:hypothetical protein
MGALTVYLIFIGIYLLKAIEGRDVQASGNTPGNLREFLLKRHTEIKENVLESVREGELLNLHTRIQNNRERSEESAKIINRCRSFIVWSPVVFGGLWILAFIVRSFSSL